MATIKRGTSNPVTKQIGRSKYAVDIMYRLWDSHNSCWVTVNSKSIWSIKRSVEKARDALIAKGRDPDTLSVERVWVELK